MPIASDRRLSRRRSATACVAALAAVVLAATACTGTRTPDSGEPAASPVPFGVQLAEPLTGFRGRVATVGSYGGAPVVVAEDGSRTLRTIDLRTGAEIAPRLTGHRGMALDIAVAEVDGTTIVVAGCHDETVRVWDLATGQELLDPLVGHGSQVFAVDIGHLDGVPVIVSGGSDLRIWDLRTGQPRGAIPVEAYAVRKVVVTERDGAPVVVTGLDDVNAWAVEVWDLGTREVVHDRLRGLGPLLAMAAGMAHGTTYLMGQGNLRGKAWVMEAAQPSGVELDTPTGAVTAAVIAEVGGVPAVITGEDDGAVRVWDIGTGAQIAELPGHDDQVLLVATTMLDGRPAVVSMSQDQTVRLASLG